LDLVLLKQEELRKVLSSCPAIPGLHSEVEFELGGSDITFSENGNRCSSVKGDL